MVVPYGGAQVSAKYKGDKWSGKADLIDGTQSYVNAKFKNVDVRIMPLNEVGGDYASGIRTLYTFGRCPIFVPVADIPVPVGEWKIQGDFQTNQSKTTIGLRGAAESFSFPTFKKGESGMKLELNAGLRFVLKLPDLFTD